MTDETPKTTDQNRAPSTSTQSVTTAPGGTQPNTPATNPTPGRLDDTDKPSDASKTQDTGSGIKPPDAPKISKPIDPQGKPAPLTLKTPQPEGQAPAKAPEAKPAVAPNAAPNAV